jgi:hypothetical protein
MKSPLSSSLDKPATNDEVPLVWQKQATALWGHDSHPSIFGSLKILKNVGRGTRPEKPGSREGETYQPETLHGQRK